MWSKPTKWTLSKFPKLGESSNAGMSANDIVIRMHFFLGACDWYAAEFDGDDTFFGFAILNGDYFNAEWGYFSLSELDSIFIAPGFKVDRELGWKPRPARDIPNIQKALVSWGAS